MNSLLKTMARGQQFINRSLLFAFLFVTVSSSQTNAQCVTLPDDCSNACDLGILPTPPACTGSGNTTGSILTFNLTNIGATPDVRGITGCAYPAPDVWYTFTATGTELVLGITGSLHSTDVSLYQGNNCNELSGISCFTATGGTLNATYLSLTVGTKYYLQISGGTLTDEANFTLKISNNMQCGTCVLDKGLTVNPPPVNGAYHPGQTVSFCYTVLDYNTASLNYLHGIVLDFGPGWDLSTLTPTSIPASCSKDTGAHWGFYLRDSSTSTNNVEPKIYGPGFFYETWRGHGINSGGTDTLPGDNYGDAGIQDTTCRPTFCWQITTVNSNACINNANVGLAIQTTGDAQSGSRVITDCLSDPITYFNAVVQCCAPPDITVINTSCGLNNNGGLIAMGGGYPPFHYEWANSSNTIIFNHNNVRGQDTIRGLARGQYFLTVFDSTGCSNVANAVIGIQPDDSFAVNAYPNCIGATSPDGSIVLNTFTPQNAPYTYQLNNGASQNTNTFSNLPIRKDTIHVTNSFGCRDTFYATIVSDPKLNITTDTVYPVTCQVGGEVVVTVTGGTAPYTYSWGDSVTGNPGYNLPQGSYTLTVTDAGRCTDTASYNIVVGPNAIQFGNGVVKPPSCDGTRDASITAVATGRGTVKYRWSNTDTTATISGLGAGFYTVRATDTAGCSATYTYQLVNPKNVVIDMSTVVPQSCTSEGVIHVIATGGTGALSYVWSQQSLSGDSVSNLTAGPYSVTVQDINNCSTSATYTVNSTVYSLSLSQPDITNPVCNGYATGSISTFATGNIGKIKYRWSNNDTTSTITGLPAGPYTLVVTDSNQCSASATYTITQPMAIDPGLMYRAAICYGSLTDTLTANPHGGTPGYTYNWSDGDTTNTDIVAKGKTYVTIYDTQNCQVTDSVNLSIESVNPNTSNHIFPSLCSGEGHAEVTSLVTGGIPPYIYSIAGVVTNSTEGADTVLNIPSGTYTILLTDSVGCTGESQLIIPKSVAKDSFSITVDSATCYGSNDGTIIVTPLNPGDGPFSYELNSVGQSSDTFTNLYAGKYAIGIVSLIYGCPYNYDTTVTQPAQHIISITPSDSVIALPGSTDTIGVSTDFVNPVYTWSPLTGLICLAPNCDSVTIQVDSNVNDTYYRVTIHGASDTTCQVTDSVLIFSHYPVLFQMPTAFTPNGDGHDDLFGPAAMKGSYAAPTIKTLHIYNRYGQLVHNSTEPWDGTFNGKEEPVGTYVYYIEVQVSNPGEAVQTMKKEGAVTLLR